MDGWAALGGGPGGGGPGGCGLFSGANHVLLHDSQRLVRELCDAVLREGGCTPSLRKMAGVVKDLLGPCEGGLVGVGEEGAGAGAEGGLLPPPPQQQPWAAAQGAVVGAAGGSTGRQLMIGEHGELLHGL